MALRHLQSGCRITWGNDEAIVQKKSGKGCSVCIKRTCLTCLVLSERCDAFLESLKKK